MYVPFPFPQCPKCGKKSEQGYHHNNDCGGNLEINPNTEQVHCPKCGKIWNIWDTKYICNCGNEFTSEEITDTIEVMLLMCKLCLSELERQQKAKDKRKELTESSMKAFVNGFFEKLGFAAGIGIETLVQLLKNLLT